jgi:hypothetical protein
MRASRLALALVIFTAGTASAQNWDQYTFKEDGFKVDFPAAPKVTTTTFKSEYGADLPAKVYTVDQGREHYKVTVADYTQAPRILDENAAKTCPKDYADERSCGLSNAGRGYWKEDLAGAALWGTYSFLQRDAKLTHLAFAWQDLVQGNEIQMINNADKSRMFAFVAMHKDKLYLFEATVPGNAPPPGLFQQSVGWVDKDGNGVRYQSIYSDVYAEHPDVFPGQPKLVGQGRAGGPAPAGAGAPQAAPAGR